MASTSTELRFHNPLGDVLCATYLRPDADGPIPAVLLCQGLSGVRRLVLPRVGEVLAAHGFATLRFDYAGFGDSGGERGWIDPAARTLDARRALELLLAQPGVDANRVGIYGHSYGGPIAIAVASGDRRLRAVAVVSGPGSGTDLLRSPRTSWDWVALRHRVAAERIAIAAGGAPEIVPLSAILPFSPAFAAAYERLKHAQGGTSAQASGSGLGIDEFYLATVDRMAALRLDLLAARVTAPTLLVNGEDDDTAPIETVEPVFASLAGEKRWMVLPGLDHNALDADPGLGEALDAVAAWFVSRL